VGQPPVEAAHARTPGGPARRAAERIDRRRRRARGDPPMTRRGWLLVISGIVILAYAGSGWTVVAPGEVVVVRRFGRVLPAAWPPGLHLGWPWGIDRKTRVRLDAVRRLPIGLVDVPGPDDDPGAGEYLTGDLNLLRAQGIVQYRVADPV